MKSAVSTAVCLRSECSVGPSERPRSASSRVRWPQHMAPSVIYGTWRSESRHPSLISFHMLIISHALYIIYIFIISIIVRHIIANNLLYIIFI